MPRRTALLIMGGADYHNTPEHYELLAGLLAGPAGLNVAVTDNFLEQNEERLARYDLLVLWATYGRDQLSPQPVEALLTTVRKGTPLLGLHAAAYTIGHAPGGAEAIGASYLGAHLPYQEFTVNVLDQEHPITAGVEDFSIRDEPYRLDIVGEGVRVLAGYDGRHVDASFRGPPTPAHEAAHTWRRQNPRAPLVYIKQLGQGKLCVNALGHDRAALTHPAFRQLVAQAGQWLIK